MARFLGRIWVRFGLWTAATVLLTTGVLTAGAYLFAEVQFRGFERELPAAVRAELRQLIDTDQEDSPRALEIYTKYWKGDLLFGDKVSLLVGLAACLPVGLFVGFWVSRALTLPLASMAEAAQRIAQGDLAVRAEPGRESGEMAEMVRHFNDMTAALEAFERERKATTAAISHELRTPLTILRARLHAACDGVIQASPAELHQWLDQAEHLGRLVDDLHTLSMADAGRLSLHLAPVDLVALARETLQRHGPRLAQSGFAVELKADVASAIVDADADRLRQVMTNLVENALRHAQSGHWLALQVSHEPPAQGAPQAARGSAVLSISDAGPGISAAARRRLFQRFAEGTPAGSGEGGRGGESGSVLAGSGLGLSIVHTLVQRHGGSIDAKVSARGGTCFTIRLPLSAPAVPALLPPQAA